MKINLDGFDYELETGSKIIGIITSNKTEIGFHFRPSNSPKLSTSFRRKN